MTDLNTAPDQFGTRIGALPEPPHGFIVLFDADRTIAEVSEGVTEILGWSPAEFASAGFELVHTEDRSLLLTMADFVGRQAGARATGTVRFRHLDGRWVHIEGAAVNRLDKPGLDGIVVTTRDVSPEMELRERNQRSHRYFEALVRNSADVFVVLDPATGVVVDAAGDVRSMLGHDRGHVTGRRLLDFAHPDDVERVRRDWKEILAAPGTSATSEYRLTTVTGSYRWVEAVTTNLADDPDVAGVVIDIRDITERRTSEDRLNALLRNGSDVVAMLDESFAVTYVSSSSERLFGRSPSDAVLGQGFLERIHPDDSATVAEAIAGLAAEPGGIATCVVRIRLAGATGWEWIEAVGENRLHEPAVGSFVVNCRIVTARVEAEQELRRSEAHFRSLAESSPLGVFTRDADGNCNYGNDQALHILGVDDVAALAEVTAPVGPLSGRPDARRSRELRLERDGEIRHVRVHTSRIGDGGAEVGLIEDVTDAVRSQRERNRLIQLVEVTSDAVFVSDLQLRALYVNEAARELAGFVGDIVGEPLLEMLTAPSRALVRDIVNPQIRDAGSWRGDLEVDSPTRGVVPVSAVLYLHPGDEAFVTGVLRDMSARRVFEQELEHQATHDALTSLPNRALLGERIDAALARARSGRGGVGLLFLDIDRFKVLNDSVGHAAADKVLVAIAERIDGVLRPEDTVARFGGDEFVVLLEHVVDHGDAERLGARLRERFQEPVLVGGQPIQVRCSIGVAFTGDGEVSAEEMLRNADTAMYRAKHLGRDRLVMFDEEMAERVRLTAEKELELSFAHERDQLRVHYQPIVDLGNGRVVSVEALVRWEHPTAGLLLPDDFIGLAEETGQIVAIGSWVVDDACRQAQMWRESRPELRSLQVSVNLSPRQFNHPGLLDMISDALGRAHLPPAALTLELTENLLLDDLPGVNTVFDELRRLGVQLVIDDFGTGYSALSYLRRFPIDGLKIDREFVAGVGTDHDDTTMVSAIVNMARSLGLTTVAEGVETDEHLDALREMRCDRAQGYLFSRPQSAEAITEMFANGARW